MATRTYGRQRVTGMVRTPSADSWPGTSSSSTATISDQDTFSLDRAAKTPRRTLKHFFKHEDRGRAQGRRRVSMTKDRVLRQSYLDLGQKDLARKTCQLCKMSYSHGLLDDEQVHTRYHRSVQKGLEWSMEGTGACEGIVCVQGDDKKLDSVLEAVDDGLGASAMSASRRAQAKVLLLLKRRSGHHGRIMAVLVVEWIDTAYRIIEQSRETALVLDQGRPVKAAMGVARIWTLPTFRRQGCARRLLDHAVRTVCYGVTLDRDHVAFTQPSESGNLLAQAWTGRQDYLVYQES